MNNAYKPKPLPNLRLKIATDLLAAQIIAYKGVSGGGDSSVYHVLELTDKLIALEAETRGSVSKNFNDSSHLADPQK